MSTLKESLPSNNADMMETYKACRKAGMSSSAALERARYADRINAVSMPWSVESEGDNEVWVKEDWDNEQLIGTWKMRIEEDSDSSTDDSDCYSEEDIEAFHNDDWNYHQVTVEYEAADGRIGEDHLGGIDAGHYWYKPEYPLNREQQVFAVALDYYELDKNSKAEALAKPLPLSAHVDHVLSYFPNVVPGRDVSYNRDGTEAIISVPQAPGVSYLISVGSDGTTVSSGKNIKWETGFIC